MRAQVNRKKGRKGCKERKWERKARALSLSLRFRKIALPLFSSLFLARAFAAETQDLTNSWAHFGPIYDRYKLTLEEGERTEILGPLFSKEETGAGKGFTFSPLFSYYTNPTLPQTEWELGYPIVTFDKFGPEYRLQIFQLIAWSGGESMKGGDKKRTTFFPFYFRETSPRPEESYTAVVPFYGHLINRLFRDEVWFVMMPLYVKSRKGEMITENYLFPFFHLRHGGGIKGWQFWPLAGHEHKEITTSTNHWGDVSSVPGHDKKFVLWPFFFKNTLGIGSTNVQQQFVLIPFYTSQVSTDRVSKSYGFPIGYTHTIDKTAKYEERDAPWPLVEFAHGEGKTARRVFPFFSQIKTPIAESSFYAWPIYKYNRVTSAPLDRERTRIALFLYSDLVERNTTNDTALRRRDLWPFFTWRKDHNENTRLQVLSILEPFLPGNKSIEKVYSPVYALYRQEKNATTGNTSRSVLWNLYRSEQRGGVRKQSALFGLFQREKNADRVKWRVFFIPFGKKSDPPATAPS